VPVAAVAQSKVISGVSNVTSKSRSPSQAKRRFSMASIAIVTSPGNDRKYFAKLSGVTAHSRPLQEIQPSELNESKETLHEAGLESFSVRCVFDVLLQLVAAPLFIYYQPAY
jgi:hypothetical protein